MNHTPLQKLAAPASPPDQSPSAPPDTVPITVTVPARTLPRKPSPAESAVPRTHPIRSPISLPLMFFLNLYSFEA